MVDIMDAILSGVTLTSFFYSKYYGAIKFRPLSNKEMDDVYDVSLQGHTLEAAQFVANHRFSGVEMKMDTLKLVMEINEIRVTMNKWIIFHAIKDFQPEKFRIVHDGVALGFSVLDSENSYLEVDQFAKKVLELTTRPKDVIRAVLETSKGEVIAGAIWNLDYQLVAKLEDLTDIQLSFLQEVYDSYEDKVNVKKTEIKTEESSLDRYLESINFKPARKYTQEQLDIVSRMEEVRKSFVNGRDKHQSGDSGRGQPKQGT